MIGGSTVISNTNLSGEYYSSYKNANNVIIISIPLTNYKHYGYSYLRLYLIMPSEDTFLVEGKYSMTGKKEPFTVLEGFTHYISIISPSPPDQNKIDEISSADVTVKASTTGEGYSIDLAGKLTNGQSIKGNATGNFRIMAIH